jgi:4-hydroxy-tetrahydrodipicolinate synthase
MLTPSPHGVIVPLLTPATADGLLDESAAAKLVAHVVAGGCGLMVCGTTGEVASLPEPARRRYVEIAVQVAAQRVPVFACIAHNSFEHSVALARAHLAAGADAVVAMLPNYFKLEPPAMRDYFVRLAAAIPGPVYLYNMPATTGMSLPVELIVELAHVENIVGLKDSETTTGRREAVADALAGRPDFALFMGSAAASIAALRLGFVGLVPSSGNLCPTWWRDLYAAARAGDWSRAEELQQRTDAFAAVYQQGRSLGQSLAGLKGAAADLGLCSPAMFSPLTAASPEERARIRSQLSHFA